MARWKLTEPHYLLLEEETRWEYVEVERVTGRPKRTQFTVPRFLHPLDPSDWTVTRLKNEDGDIIVCNGNNPGPGDLIYKGQPTPGMLPLDDEAKKLSGKFDWKPTEGLDDFSQNDSYANKLLGGLIDQMTEARTQASQIQAQPVQIEGMADMLKAMTAMMEQNQALLAKLMERPAGIRR